MNKGCEQEKKKTHTHCQTHTHAHTHGTQGSGHRYPVPRCQLDRVLLHSRSNTQHETEIRRKGTRGVEHKAIRGRRRFHDKVHLQAQHQHVLNQRHPGWGVDEAVRHMGWDGMGALWDEAVLLVGHALKLHSETDPGNMLQTQR